MSKTPLVGGTQQPGEIEKSWFRKSPPTSQGVAWNIPPARSGGDKRGGMLLSCLKINSGTHPN